MSATGSKVHPENCVPVMMVAPLVVLLTPSQLVDIRVVLTLAVGGVSVSEGTWARASTCTVRFWLTLAVLPPTDSAAVAVICRFRKIEK